MRYQTFVRAAAGVLATVLITGGGASAQTTQPDPATMVDTEPLPATERDSIGAVILMDEPVLAQREQLMQAQERTEINTRAMGAGPERLLRGIQTKEELEFQRALEEAERHKRTPK